MEKKASTNCWRWLFCLALIIAGLALIIGVTAFAVRRRKQKQQ